MPLAKRHKKNVVREGAKARVSVKAIQKSYIPGIYSQHHPSQCDHKLKSRPIHLKSLNATEGKTLLKIVEPENVREHLVPGRKTNLYPAIWQQDELLRIQKAGKIITREERLAEIAKHVADKKRLEEECEERKKKLQANDKGKEKKSKTTEEKDEEMKQQRVLDVAFIAKQEQSEEMKRANRLILSAKCRVVRDAQIAEKQQIERELREEECRLEQIAINESLKAIKAEEEGRSNAQIKKEKYCTDLKAQLQKREMARVLQAELIEEEAIALAQAKETLVADEEEKRKLDHEKKIRMRRELQKNSEISQHYKNLSTELERLSEIQAQEYMKKKSEIQKQQKLDKKLTKEQKQRDQDRLFQLQMKQLLTKGENDEMILRRNQEEKEREFRRKEKEAALKRIQQENELRAARAKQLEELTRTRAYQMAEDEYEFNRVLNYLKDAEQKDKELQKLAHENKERYRSEIIEQINKKELSKRTEKEQARREFLDKINAMEQEKHDIKLVIATKIKAMKKANVPDRLIKEVERRLSAI